MKLPIVIISYKSITLLDQFLSNLSKDRDIFVIENSDQIELKEQIEKKFKNCKVIINNKNLGYGKAANIGFKEIKDKYAFVLEPDIKINENQLLEIESEVSNCDEDFALATPLYKDLIDFNKNNEFDKDFSEINLDMNSNETKTKIDLIKGCSLIVNLDKFKDKYVFDENFFFFFEDIDLCKRVKIMKENIFVFNKIKIIHEGAKGVNPSISQNYSDFRHWNFFWAKFYYFKKHYGYFYALLKHFGKLIRFPFNCLRYYFISDAEYRKNKYRFLGLLNSVCFKESSLSKTILEK